MKLQKVASFLILIFLSACGVGYQTVTHDDADGCHIVHRTQLNKVFAERNDLGMYGQISIDGEFYEPKMLTDAEHSTLVISSITFPGHQIQTDSSFVLTIDDKSYIFSSMHSQYKSELVDMARSPYLLESAKYEVDKNIFRLLGNAKSISYILKGKERILNGTMSTINISRFNMFYEEHVR